MICLKLNIIIFLFLANRRSVGPVEQQIKLVSPYACSFQRIQSAFISRFQLFSVKHSRVHHNCYFFTLTDSLTFFHFS